MPAISKAQQKLFGIVHAIQKGKANPKQFSPVARKLANTMSHGDVKKYATTPIKDLPKKIAELLKQDINAGAQHGDDTDTDVQPFGQQSIDTIPSGGVEETIGTTDTSITPDFPPATSSQPHISNDPHRVDFTSEDYSEKQNKIFSIVKDKRADDIDGVTVDVYTAALLTKVLRTLSLDNRKKMLELPTEKMVATAYKLITR